MRGYPNNPPPGGVANLIRYTAMRMTHGSTDNNTYRETINHLTRFGRSLLVLASQLDWFVEALEEIDDAEHELRGAIKVPDSEQED